MNVSQLETRLGESVPTGRGIEVRFCCPFCIHKLQTADEGFHLYYNKVKDKWYCHRCGTAGDLSYLEELFGFESVAIPDDKFMEKLDEIFIVKPPPVFDRVLPPDYCKILLGTEAHRYLLSRGVTNEDIDNFGIGFGTQRMYQLNSDVDKSIYAGIGRVIFPDYDKDNELEYWVARTYKDHKVKYKNCPWPALDQVFNLSRVRHGDLLITEGPLDAIVSSKYVDGQVVCCYGKHVTSDQVLRLCKEFDGTYYIALDPDAMIEAIKLAESLYSRRKYVRIVKFPPNEDPASVGPAIVDYMSNSEEFDPCSIML